MMGSNLRIAFSVVWSLYASLAYAQQRTLLASIEQLSPGAMAIALGLSLLGGLTYAFAVLADELTNPDIVMRWDRRLAIRVISWILASAVAGLVTYFLMEWKETNPFLEAGMIVISGYGGTRVLNTYLMKYIINNAPGAYQPKPNPPPPNNPPTNI